MKLNVDIPTSDIAGCIDFLEQAADSIPQAIQDVISAFVAAMRAKGAIPTRHDSEYANMVDQLTQWQDDPLDSVKAFLPRRTTPSDSIGQEVERAIESAATPRVGQVFHVMEKVEEVPEQKTLINVYEQLRMTLAELRAVAPKDRLIEQAWGMIQAGGPLLDPEKRLFIAALELTYSFLSKDFWGTPKAEEQIKKFISIHDGSLP